ncbi:MAG: hypothetical protein AUK47_02960 [Deltaproteobacteria bacterium CG2_30_63_29]|nr:MAG: hypothetical protein AUK47_02960 [Deltaproteobacteria bacterium CG2_30_63_29]PIW02346.1 MAG: hypothetical protein COW42_02080 [Deltaproteobacteria bacterium CG17_big_fil_post_rev_8_21_14_2_50_63_7]PJB35693.1 MAG: hypothetical protein CO108_25010 [Deltaproteobacteria bacterium CG_4_9_14_3_um_filter_63_12]
MSRLALLTALALCLSASTASAVEYPKEVRDAFMSECTGAEAPELVCLCVLVKMEANISLNDLSKQNFDNEKIVKWSEECVATNNLGMVEAPKVDPVDSEVVVSWGPECRTYFDEVRGWCTEPNLSEQMKAGCDAWMQGVATMQSSLSGLPAETVTAAEDGCKSAVEALRQARAALR